MKEELKTLKDMEERFKHPLKYDGIFITLSQIIKKEAVRDIKAIQGTEWEWTKKDIIDFLKWKNNLTEEDLKGVEE